MATTIYNGSVTLFKGVPFDPSYKNIFRPQAVSAKAMILEANFTHTTISNIQTIKLNTSTGRGTVRLTVNSADAYEYNYMHIADSKHGLSMFAFINGCTYINDGPTDPTHAAAGYQCVYEFDITKDVMMTHFTGDGQLYSTSIVRHTATNTFKDGRHPESITPTTSIYNKSSMNARLGVWGPEDCLCVVMFNFTGLTNYSAFYNIPNSCIAIIYKNAAEAVVDVNTRLSSAPGAQVFNLYVIPKCMFSLDPSTIPSTGLKLDDVTMVKSDDVTPYQKSNIKAMIQNGAGITVKNKKCFYYPFTKLRLVGNEGSSIEMKPECFRTNDIKFKIRMSGLCPVNITAEPMNYTETTGTTYVPSAPAYLRCSSGSYPVGNGSLDTYAGYIAERFKFGDSKLGQLAQLGVEAIPNALGSVFGAAIHGSSGGVAGAGVGISYVGSYGNEMLTQEAMQRKADKVAGSMPAPNVDYVAGSVDIYLELESVTPEVLTAVDDYFERYGYSQGGILATPDVQGRDRYVYVRTGGECISCSTCNASELALMNAVFMNGVTVWQSAGIVNGKLTYGNNGTDPIADI